MKYYPKNYWLFDLISFDFHLEEFILAYPEFKFTVYDYQLPKLKLKICVDPAILANWDYNLNAILQYKYS